MATVCYNAGVFSYVRSWRQKVTDFYVVVCKCKYDIAVYFGHVFCVIFQDSKGAEQFSLACVIEDSLSKQ
jgi:hypothetical protein